MKIANNLAPTPDQLSAFGVFAINLVATVMKANGASADDSLTYFWF